MKRILVLSLILLGSGALAQEKMNLAQLPPYCKARIDPVNRAEYQAGELRFGKGNWDHLHHYCYALDFMSKARRTTDKNARRHFLNNVRTNLEYIVTHTRSDFVMRPQVYVELADALNQLQNPGAAQGYLEKAVAFNPGYERAYISLLELLRARKDRAAVLDVATRGLRQLPDSKFLQEAYLEAGGQRPFPEAVAKSESLQTEIDAGVDPGEIAEESQAGAADSDPPADTSVPDQGCRFCPPDEIMQRWKDSFEQSK